MAETTNYDLPIPNHLGIQQAEIQRIAEAMTLIDTLLKSVNDSLATKLAAAGYTAADVLAKLKTVDGAGSGLDADLLDGQSSAYYRDVANLTGVLPDGRVPPRIRAITSSVPIADANNINESGWYFILSSAANIPVVGGNGYIFQITQNNVSAQAHVQLWFEANGTRVYRRHVWYGAGTWTAWERVRWTEAEQDARYANVAEVTAASILAKLLTVDGTASGLDADKLRGLLPDAAATANTIAQRDGNGNLAASRFRSDWSTLNASPNYVITQNVAGGGDNYYQPTSLAQFKTALSITVADVADAVPTSRQITAGNGLTGGGNFTADRAFAVGAGVGIQVTATQVNVDDTVWRDDNPPTQAQINTLIGYTPANNAVALLRTGGTMTGPLTLAGAPTTDLQPATKKYVDDGQAFSKVYESAEQAVVTGGTVTLAHGLGSVPKVAIAILICKTAEQGFAVGDQLVFWGGFHTDSGTSRGCHIAATSTQLKIQYSNQGGATFQVFSASGGVISLTNANWNLIVRAYA